MSESVGIWRRDLLDHVRNVIRDDIARGRYFGAVIKVARGGEVGLETAIGDEGGPGTKPLGMDAVFSLFSATKAKDREVLGDRITSWLRANPATHIVDKQVSMSSDREFHCLSIVLFFSASAPAPAEVG